MGCRQCREQARRLAGWPCEEGHRRSAAAAKPGPVGARSCPTWPERLHSLTNRPTRHLVGSPTGLRALRPGRRSRCRLVVG
eukprot:4215161-Alexandrium_andersonii.AAC.1